jgi:hypothetical protein
MILLVIFLAVLLLVYLIALGMFLAEYDGILDDQTMKDYLDKLGDNYTTYMGEYSQRIDPTYSANVNKSIERSPSIISLVFPYNIGYVGVIPAWSKSKPRIDAMFAQGVKSNWKRKKLGLE